MNIIYIKNSFINHFRLRLAKVNTIELNKIEMVL